LDGWQVAVMVVVDGRWWWTLVMRLAMRLVQLVRVREAVNEVRTRTASRPQRSQRSQSGQSSSQCRQKQKYTAQKPTGMNAIPDGVTRPAKRLVLHTKPHTKNCQNWPPAWS
jgi:hypothetical protein